jgi:hypothetical protein
VAALGASKVLAQSAVPGPIQLPGAEGAIRSCRQGADDPASRNPLPGGPSPPNRQIVVSNYAVRC